MAQSPLPSSPMRGGEVQSMVAALKIIDKGHCHAPNRNLDLLSADA